MDDGLPNSVLSTTESCTQSYSHISIVLYKCVCSVFCCQCHVSKTCSFTMYNDGIFFHQSGISIDTTGTTHLAGYSCITGLRCGSTAVSSGGGLKKILSENLHEMLPYSCRKGHVPRRKSQKSFLIPNHPVKDKL